NEPDALPRHRADQLLALAGIADGLASGSDPAAERRLRDDAPAPHRRDEVILGDDPVTVVDQINKQIKDLRFDSDEIGAPAKLAPADAERIAAEFEPQEPTPRP